MACHCFGLKGTYYLNCEVVEPAEHKGKTIQFPISELVLSKKQIAKGKREKNTWWMRKVLDTVFHYSGGHQMTMSTVEQVNQTLLNLWCWAPTTGR
eukprot:459906-Rhodomonas_salina.1